MPRPPDHPGVLSGVHEWILGAGNGKDKPQLKHAPSERSSVYSCCGGVPDAAQALRTSHQDGGVRIVGRQASRPLIVTLESHPASAGRLMVRNARLWQWAASAR